MSSGWRVMVVRSGAAAVLVSTFLAAPGCYTQLKQAPAAEVDPGSSVPSSERGAGDPDGRGFCERWNPIPFDDHVMVLSVGEAGEFDGVVVRFDNVTDYRRLIPVTRHDSYVGTEILGDATIFLTVCPPGGEPFELLFTTIRPPQSQVFSVGVHHTIRPVSLEPVRRESDPLIADHQYRFSLLIGYRDE